jgi:predicted nucleic acid-binding protein
MQWIEQLRGETVGLDTAPLIYLIERNPNYLEMMRFFFRALNSGEFRVVTSTVTLLEVLVYPLRGADSILVQQYRNLLFNSQYLRTIEVDAEIAETAAQLRAIHNVQSLDSIHKATAVREGASFFLTNDVRLPSLPALQVLVLDELRNP